MQKEAKSLSSIRSLSMRPTTSPRASRAVRAPIQTELAAAQARSGLDALGEIVGRIDNERMLDKLFASFCIGK